MYNFYNQIFNPQYINQQYYYANLQEIQRYNEEQNREVENAIKAMHDFIEATKKLDYHHKQMVQWGVIAEIGKELNW